jgi:hypothetical protein
MWQCCLCAVGGIESPDGLVSLYLWWCQRINLHLYTAIMSWIGVVFWCCHLRHAVWVLFGCAIDGDIMQMFRCIRRASLE